MIDVETVTAALVERLPAYLAEQRWAGVQPDEVTGVRSRWWEVVCDDDDVALLWGIVDLQRGDEALAYQLFIGVRPVDDLPDFLHGKEREVVGRLPGLDRDLLAYDALVDPDLAVAVLHLVAPDVEGGGAAPAGARALEQLGRVRRGADPQAVPPHRGRTEPRCRDQS